MHLESFLINPHLFCLVADEMYVFSSSNKRVSVQLVGKDEIQNKLSHFEKLSSASLAYLGVSSAGPLNEISSVASSK